MAATVSYKKSSEVEAHFFSFAQSFLEAKTFDLPLQRLLPHTCFYQLAFLSTVCELIAHNGFNHNFSTMATPTLLTARRLLQ